MHEGGWICAVGEGKVLCSVRRVDGVPRDKVQSTDEEASDLLPSKASSSVNLLPDAGKKIENEAAPPQSNPHEHCCVLLWWPHWCNMAAEQQKRRGRRRTKEAVAKSVDPAEGSKREGRELRTKKWYHTAGLTEHIDDALGRKTKGC